MSALPSRTRSLRKPADSNSSRYGRAESETNPTTLRTLESKLPQTTALPSPSRLPAPRSRPTSLYGRPPSASGTVPSNASMRPPPARANISNPTTSGLQPSSSTRVSNASASTSTEPVKTDRSRPPVTTSRHLRNPSLSNVSSLNSSVSSARGTGHARTKSSSTLLSSTTTLRPPSRDLVRDPQSISRLAATESLMRKPAFSTLQQHFSPAKTLGPKPHPSAFLVPPSPSKLPSNIAISAETAKLQNELLQLHLLHRDAIQVQGEWRASAKRKLGDRFKSVVKRNEDLLQLEVEETSKINALALKKWQDQGTPGWDLEDKIQVLDEVVTGVWNLAESGGKYVRVVRKFERWLSRCRDTMQARASDDFQDDVMFLEGLDGNWKDDCHNLGRKLENWRDHLKDLGSVESSSSLGATVDGCRKMVANMLMELNVMGKVEAEAMRMESGWIRQMNDDNSDDEDIPTAGAVWRA